MTKHQTSGSDVKISEQFTKKENYKLKYSNNKDLQGDGTFDDVIDDPLNADEALGAEVPYEKKQCK